MLQRRTPNVVLAALVVAGVLGSTNGCYRMSSGTADGHSDTVNDPDATRRSDGARLVYSAITASQPKASAQNPAFSPDGSRIVFTRFASGYNKGPAELWIIKVDGSDAPEPPLRCAPKRFCPFLCRQYLVAGRRGV